MSRRDGIKSFYPLSATQQGILFHSLAETRSGMYVGQMSFRLEGRLDVAALRRAWHEVIARHGALRTSFRWRELAEPVQVVSKASPSPFLEIDWRRLPAARRERLMEELLRDDRRRGFDLSRAPLVRMILVRLEDGVAELLWTRHHLIVDGWSVSLLFQEILRRYAAHAAKDREALPMEPAPRYRDYIAWTRRQDPSEAERLWRRELAGLSRPSTFDYGTPEAPGATGEERWGDVVAEIPWSTTAGLAALGRRHGLTLATLVQAAWAILLGRYQGRDDVLFGTVVSGRPTELPGVQGMVGLFINTQPLRARPHPGRPFLDWVRDLQAHQADLRRTEHLALHQIQGWSGMPRGQGMFETLLVYENYPVDPLLLGESQPTSGEQATEDVSGQGLAAAGMRIARSHSKERTNYPLTVVVRQGKTLPVSLTYDRVRMSAADVARLAGHLRRLLDGVVERPETLLGELPWMSEAERHRLLVEWEGPERSEETSAAALDTLDALVAARAAQTPDAVAVEQGSEHLTFRRLMERADGFAAALADAGVGPGDRVGVGLERSPDLLVALLAVLRRGAAYVPLDPGYPRARHVLMLEDAAPRALLAEPGSELARLAEDGGWELPVLAPMADGGPAIGEGASVLAPHPPAAAAYVIYTSGSTGRPKGVVVPHGAVVNFLRSMARRPGLGPDDVLVAVTSLSFDISVLELFLPLAVGGRVVIAERSAAADGHRLRRRIEESGATVMQATPATWRILLGAGFRARPPFRQLCGGEALGGELAGRLLAGGAELWNLYGPTETTVWSSAAAVTPGGVDLGLPLDRTRLRVVDPRLRLLPAGVPGELVIGGAGLARGYLGRPAVTAERFLPDPFGAEPGARLYRTGDGVRVRSGGTLDYLGRLDFQVKVRGHRIELGEVEAALEALDEVSQAVVVVRRDSVGEGRLVAYVVPRPEGPEGAPRGASGVAPDRVRRRVGESLPAVMVPSVVVPIEAVPLTPNGKIDRKALPDPGSERPDLATELVRPRNRFERGIADVWCRVLDLDEVGLEDNFFDLGGHSILAIRVHEEIQKAFDVELPLIELFEHPTVAALARRLAPEAAAAPAVRVAERRRPIEPSEGIAVVGMSGRFPGSASVESLWESLCAGEEGVRDLSSEELSAVVEEVGLSAAALATPDVVVRRGVLAEVDRFDAAFFGISAREAELMDPQHRLFLEVCAEALDAAGHPDESSGRIGVFAGTSLSGYLLHHVYPHLAARGFDSSWPMVLGNDKDHLATRVSYLLGLTGPSLLVQTACSTGLAAVHLARRSLLCGECDLALAGASAVRIPQALPQRHQEGGIVSASGRCRAYDASADGTVGGNGVGVVVLRRLSEALADGDTVHAVLRGSAMNNDGSGKVGYTAPGLEGQERVLRAALAEAGFEPSTVGYVEGHGTGTALGDPIEVTALNRAYSPREGCVERGSCALGSIKTNLGHLDTASGIAGLIKAVLVVERGQIPPTLHFEEPSPRIPWEEGPFHVPRGLVEWPEGGGPRRAGVSSFGLGGTNVHVVLEQCPAREEAEEAPPGAGDEHALLLSAKTATALERTTERLAEHLRRHPELSLADVEHTLAVGRRSHAHRRVVFAEDRQRAVDALEGRDPARVRTTVVGRDGHWTAFLFPGQGTVRAGMGRDLFERQPVFREALERCDRGLHEPLGESLLDALYGPDASDEALARTRLSQPAVFVLSHALAELWSSWGVAPDLMLGHSVGEYVAAQRAGVFDLDTALSLIARRGALMQALPAGAMLALDVSAERAEELLVRHAADLAGPEGGIELAADNGPEATVVSGPIPAMETFEKRLEQEGLAGRRLATSHAFHSAMMEPVLDAFREEVARHVLRPPAGPVLSNLTGDLLTADQATSPDYWVRHLRNAVRFGPALARVLAEPGTGLLLEVGPGRSLSSLARRALAARARTGQGPDGPVRVAVSMPSGGTGGKSSLAAVTAAAADCWLTGAPVDWRQVREGRLRRPGRRVPLPATAFDDHRFWVAPGAAARASGATGDDVVLRLRVPTWTRQPNGAPVAVAAAPSPPAGTLLLVPDGATADLLAPLAGAPGTVERLVGNDGETLAERLRGAAGARVLWAGAGWSDEADAEPWTLRSALALARVSLSESGREPGLAELVVLTRGREEVRGGDLSEAGDTAEAGAAVARAVADALARRGAAVRSVDLPAEAGAEVVARVVPALAPTPARALERGRHRRFALRGDFLWSADTVAEPVETPDGEGAGAPVDGRLSNGAAVVFTGADDPAVLALALSLAERRPLRIALLPGVAPGGTVDAAAPRLLAALEERAVTLWRGSGEVEDLPRALAEAAAALGGLDVLFHRRGAPFGSGAKDDGKGTAERIRAALDGEREALDALAGAIRRHRPAAVVLHGALDERLGDDPAALARAELAASWVRRRAGEAGEADTGAGDALIRWRMVSWPLEPAAVSDESGAPDGSRAVWAERILALDDAVDARVAPRTLAAWRARRRGGASAGGPAAVPAAEGGGTFRPPTAVAYEAPIGEMEERLAAIWEDLLGVSPVGRHDDFFELGGHSLLATQVMARVRDVLGRDVSVRTLFEAPRIAALASALESALAAGSDLSEAFGSGAGVPVTAPIQRIDRDRPALLSFSQQRLWFLDQLAPGSPVYNLPFGLRLSGRLRPAALAGALAALVARHEILRTRFESCRGEPRQVIDAAGPHPLPVIDLTAMPPGRRRREAEGLAAAEGRLSFALDRGPLLRTRLLRVADDEHLLTLTIHHIVADGWSLGIIAREVAAGYRRRAGASPVRLPELPVQYADYAAWQRERLRGETLQAELRHWRERLEGAPAALDVPADHRRPALPDPRGEEVRFAIGPACAEAVRRLLRGRLDGRGATLFMVLLAAFETLLHRVSGTSDVVVGSPVANRTRTEAEGLIGFFVNTLVLRTDLSGDPSFEEAVERVRETSIDAQAHQDLPFELLVQELQPDRDLSRSPLFQVLFTLQNTPFDPLELPELSLAPWERATGATPFDLGLSLSERGDRLAGALTYRRDLFDRTTVRRLARAFERLLGAAVAAPDTPLSRLPLLGPAEHHQVAVELAAGRPARPPVEAPADSLPARLLAMADRAPEREAVVAGELALPWGELRNRSLALARRLRALGLPPESPVGVAMERTPDLVVALWGVMAAGCVFVPLDPRHPARRLRTVAEDAGIEALLTDGASREALGPGLARHELRVDGALAEAVEAPESAQPPLPPVDPDALAYVLYTSGSTGRPKGVEVFHRSLIGFLDAMAERPGCGPDDVLAAVTTLSFDISLLEIFLPLVAGGRTALVDAETAADPRALARELGRVGATLMQATPATWHQLLASGWENRDGLRLLSGGEALPRELADRMAACAPEVWNLYGPTEATVWISAARVIAGEGSLSDEWPVDLGRPLPGARMDVLDARLAPVPLAVPGELHLVGPSLARGYRALPARTAASFLPDPVARDPGARIYRTGDRVRRDGRGRLLFLGRTDQQVKVRGFRIETGEIESALLAHPEVERAVVVALGDAADARLVAYLVTASGAEIPAADLRTFLAERLPAYMLPTDFVALDALPLGPSGKVDRKALPAPERARSEAEPLVAPRDETEEAVAVIWREVLAVDRVGVHDNFFELGGHSLLATQVMSRILETFDLEIPLRRLFATPTVAGLAEAVREAGTTVLDAAEEELLRRVEEMNEEGVAEELARLMAEGVENP